MNHQPKLNQEAISQEATEMTIHEKTCGSTFEAGNVPVLTAIK